MTKAPNMKALELKISKAKAALVLEQPFFAALLLKMPMICDPALAMPTMATNGKVIKWHPAFVEKCDLDELKFVLCHEVMHPALQHIFRRGDRKLKRWNAAGDYIINEMLVNEKIGRMPVGALHNPALTQAGGGTAEGVYELLESQGGGQDDSGDDDDGDQSYPNGDGSRGQPLDSLEDPPGSPAEQAAQAAEWKVSVAQAAQAAKMCGRLSAGLRRFVDEALRPVVDWREVLRRFVSARAKVEPSFARPKRRWIGEDIILPSLSGERMGRVVVAVDCSGSIGAKELSEFAAEMRAIKEDVRPDAMEVIYWDAQVCHHDSFGPDDELRVEPHGGGGTVFEPVLAYIEEKEIEPVCCVVLTDLCIGGWGDPPPYPVLWISTHGDQAPWGEVVRMPKGGA